ncbi:MAG: cytochrome b/b6 domain-containing protein [Betaproteobacteria bacterium]|nr:cytochrome b/b6 domain-containing protein [Betaproteobacteria bacterium]
MTTRKIKLWDLPTRLFHWLLAATVAGALVSGQIGGNAMDWHGRLGLATIGLVVFRLVWGLAGSTYARFAQFLPRPAQVRAYLQGRWQSVGHNPLGALSVLALLLLIAAQAGTGLFANDDIAFRGYLYSLADSSLSGQLTEVHELLSNLLIGLVVLHIAAVVFHTRVKKDNLVKPMLTGWKETEQDVPSASGGGLLALVVALLLATAAVYGASGAWLPPPPSAATAPSW